MEMDASIFVVFQSSETVGQAARFIPCTNSIPCVAFAAGSPIRSKRKSTEGVVTLDRKELPKRLTGASRKGLCLLPDVLGCVCKPTNDAPSLALPSLILGIGGPTRMPGHLAAQVRGSQCVASPRPGGRYTRRADCRKSPWFSPQTRTRGTTTPPQRISGPPGLVT